MTSPRMAIIGAGPAGLTAARELAQRGLCPLVLEASRAVGGLARTEQYRGYRFDIGGHRFFTRHAEIRQVWRETLGADLLRVSRLSRIVYRQRLFDYPLSPFNALVNLGAIESTRVIGSYAASRLWPVRPEATFEDWMRNRFGRRLYDIFFRSYTEKVWGIPGHRMGAEWAAQRIRGLSLGEALKGAVFGGARAPSLIPEFDYPRLGAGQIWERFAADVESAGGTVLLDHTVTRVAHAGGRVTHLAAAAPGGERQFPVAAVISTMPLARLVASLDPEPPAAVREAAAGLKHRAVVVVLLIVARRRLFPDTWLYVHDRALRVGRVQNLGNWSEALLADSATSALGLEYFCSEGDGLWDEPDEAMMALARREVETLGLASASEMVDGRIVRQRDAYPVYDPGYTGRVGAIRKHLDMLPNLQTIGRGGMHRYNNQDHSMLTGRIAAANVVGGCEDPWLVNGDDEYLEMAEFEPGVQS